MINQDRINRVEQADWDRIPAVSDADGYTPTEEEIQVWALRYVPEESAGAFASHVWMEWEDHEPDGVWSLEDWLCILLRQWRGEDGFPLTPDPWQKG